MASKGVAATVAGLFMAFGAPALAQAPASDAPVASARSDAVDAQIAAYLNQAAPDAPIGTTPSSLASDAPPADRRVHGEVGASIGTRGYREMHAAIVAPVGQNGEVAVAVGQMRGRGFGGPADLGLMPPSPDQLGDRAPARRASAPSCDKDKPGAAPLWVERMRRLEPAGTSATDCPASKP